jgi:hypothetical protein
MPPYCYGEGEGGVLHAGRGQFCVHVSVSQTVCAWFQPGKKKMSGKLHPLRKGIILAPCGSVLLLQKGVQWECAGRGCLQQVRAVGVCCERKGACSGKVL